MNLTMTHMELLLQGDFLGLIKAEVFVSASYSLTFDSAEFYVRVTVDLDGINEVRKTLICSVSVQYSIPAFLELFSVECSVRYDYDDCCD